MMKKCTEKRIADKQLEELLDASGAVLIEDPKWCGKTTTAEQHAKSVIYLNDPAKEEQIMLANGTGLGRLLKGDKPRLIDEWQILPSLWDAIRFEVDHSTNGLGQFILTGSAVPAKRDSIHHTGTGRFSWLSMRTMSLWESGDSSGEVGLGSMFDGKQADAGDKNMSIEELAFLACRGGWPGALSMGKKAALKQARLYVDAVCNTDISRVDDVRRDSQFCRKLLRSYSRNLGTQASISTLIADNVANDRDTLNEATLSSYLTALRKIFMIEDMSAWNPNLKSKSAIRTSDTRYFTDPSLAVAALAIGPDDLLNDLKTFGFIFENMAIRDLRVYADALDGHVYHFRDRNGLECDAVVHLRNGHYGLVEI